MNFVYGQPLQLRDDINLNFYVDGIYPAGQLGYAEPHYKIMFDEAPMVIPHSMAVVLFCEKEKNMENNKSESDDTSPAPIVLKKLNKDDLIALAVQIDSSKDLTKLKKDQLIELIEAGKK
jgi:hypothetical protein